MTEIKHSEREHSVFSPSAFERWSRCPASALFTADMPREDSEASLRGTWCHEQVDRLFGGEEIDTESEYWSQSTEEDILFAYEYTKELIAHCGVLNIPDVWHEQPVGNSKVFGTCDLRVYDPDTETLWVVDYKFGYGVVPAKGNGQLLMYAAMADNTFEKTVREFNLVILQPTNKRQPVDTWRITSQYLTEWYKAVCLPALDKASQEDAEFVPGEKQCRWCPASGACPAQRDHSVEVFDEYDSKDPARLDYEKLLPLLGEMQEFINGVHAQARKVALNGHAIKGYKLVKKVTRSRWKDKEKAEKWLAARKIPKALRTQTTVVPIGKAEKLVWDQIKDKPILQKNFKQLIHKPEGDLTLVPDDDPRPPEVVGNPLLEDDMI